MSDEGQAETFQAQLFSACFNSHNILYTTNNAVRLIETTSVAPTQTGNLYFTAVLNWGRLQLYITTTLTSSIFLTYNKDDR
ncbi:hypothetical protein DGMP_29150 [Desulfomarina profundi]|uniref:Uncharacterized protein n=1 Tax=Desulfomarina profundi TaxID=2772557 RepID=A0A8D5FYC2_9BACT|nr:hypothetical protein DGMP_29150 [Desulfomarina profundi]